MGLVVEAVHLQLDERVAIKFLRREVRERPDVLTRFEAESRSAVKLKNEHVARVYDVGDHQGTPYMVMEFLDGQDLSRVLHDSGPLPIPDAVEHVIQACEGLGEAHARGVVHRDVKPENLFLALRDDGWKTVKVLDFGISLAKLTANIDESSGALGSPYYMSPEQLRGDATDHRADIWSLGVTLFELLTSTMPFVDTSDVQVLIRDITQGVPRDLRSALPDAPPELAATVSRCLEKDPGRRFQNTAELAIALLPFARRRARTSVERLTNLIRSSGLNGDRPLLLPASQPPLSNDPAHVALTGLPLVISPPPSIREPEASQATMPVTEPRRPRKALLLLPVALALVLGVGVLVTLTRRTTHEDPSATGAVGSTKPSQITAASVDSASQKPRDIAEAPMPIAGADASNVADVDASTAQPSPVQPPRTNVKPVPWARPATTTSATRPVASPPSTTGDLGIIRER